LALGSAFFENAAGGISVATMMLETLKKWRFFPAMEDGKPIASSIDIRIPISVR